MSTANETLSRYTDYSYSLTVSGGGSDVSVAATSPYGAIYGLETFLQLVDGAGNLLTSSVSISDYPEYEHRGVMIDTGRRFWPVTAVEEVIDAMVLLKQNVLHFHASDYCRESVESKTFPNLTASLTGVFGGFFAQTDIASLISYGKDRGVRVVPEFDMPGHAKGFDPLMDKGMQFCDPSGPAKQIYNDATGHSVGLLNAFLQEMSGLFEDELFHLGCDETEVTGPCSLSSTAALESELFKRTLTTFNKTPVAWEEALFDTGSAVPGTVINAWSRYYAPQVVAKGYEAIESHSGWFYLNHIPTTYQTLWQDIGGPQLPPAQRSLLRGGEISLWTDDFCTYTQCYEPTSKPEGSALFPPAMDSEFTTAALGILYPRGLVGAGSFYRFDSSVDPNSLDFEILYNTVADRLNDRGVQSCPTACSCDYQQRCGQYFIPCDAAAADQNVATFTCPAAGSESAGNFQFTNSSNHLQLKGTSLCLGINGKDPSSGFPNVALVDCSNQPLSLTVLPTKQLKDAGTGYCLDITASGTSQGSNVELYSCDSGTVYPNQQYEIGSDGTITNLNSHLCVGVCAHAD